MIKDFNFISPVKAESKDEVQIAEDNGPGR